jgi:integrase
MRPGHHFDELSAGLRLFTGCGLRVSELCGLKPVLSLPKGLEDIDLKESLLYVKGRYVPLPPDAKAALRAWLD